MTDARAAAGDAARDAAWAAAGWTWTADFPDVYRAYLRTHRAQPPKQRRYRVPRGVIVGVGPAHVNDEREWDWHD